MKNRDDIKKNPRQQTTGGKYTYFKNLSTIYFVLTSLSFKYSGTKYQP